LSHLTLLVSRPCEGIQSGLAFSIGSKVIKGDQNEALGKIKQARPVWRNDAIFSLGAEI
jgi:hypothetical protein